MILEISKLLIIIHHIIDMGITFVFDTRYHQEFATPQPMKLKFDFWPPVPAAVELIRYALLSANQIIWINSDGQGQFDIR